MRLAVALLCAGACLALPPAAFAQSLSMSARAGFDGLYKQSEWMPVAVDLDTRGEEVTGALTAVIPNPGGATATTYLRPVALGSRASQRVWLYLRGSALPSPLTVALAPQKGPRAEAAATLTALSRDDTLVVVVAADRGTLSFLSGTARGQIRVRRGPSPYGGPFTTGRGTIRVADMSPDLLPDLAQGYSAVDLVVIGDISARSLRPEAKEALRRWVLAGGTLAVMGGPDWARLKDPFFADLLPVEPVGAAEVQGLDALGRAYGRALPGPAVVTRGNPRAGASVRLRQGDLPLIVDGPAGSGRVIFLAFDAARPPLRGWPGQTALWNDCLSRAESATPLLRAALEDTDPGYPYRSNPSGLPAAVLNIPAMQTPPFWGVALFLMGYVVLLVPVNYAVLKWRRRRELAWITTPAIVLLFAFLAYFIGYGMKGGRLLVNQLSLIETRAGARTAGLVSLAGMFSPAKTSYQVGTAEPSAAISEVELDPRGRDRKNLTVLQTDTMSLSRVPMDMWSMRVFEIDGMADLGGGLDGRLTLGNRRATGRIANHTGLRLTGCQVRLGGAVQNLGDLADGAAARLNLNTGAGQPAPIGHGYPPGYTTRGSPRTGSSAAQMRSAVEEVFFGSASGAGGGLAAAQAGGGAVLTGWCDKQFADLSVAGRSAKPTHLTFVMVHLPLTPGGQGHVSIPYGVCENAIVEEQGTNPAYPGYSPGLRVGSGYVVREFRLPIEGAPIKITRLEAYADYSAGGPSPTQPSLSAYNWRAGRWDALPGSRGAVTVADPADHVRLPQGVVRLKFQGPTTGAAPGGAELTLNHLDVSLQGDAR